MDSGRERIIISRGSKAETPFLVPSEAHCISFPNRRVLPLSNVVYWHLGSVSWSLSLMSPSFSRHTLCGVLTQFPLLL